MSLGICLVNAVDRSIQLSSFFPLLTYKVGTVAAGVLHFHNYFNNHNHGQVFFAVVSEVICLSLAMFISLYSYEIPKSQLTAYASGLGGWNFPLRLSRIISENAYIAAFTINGVRCITALASIDNIHFKTRFKQMKERDVIPLFASAGLLIFCVWACIQAVNIKGEFKPDFDRCYK